MAFILAFNLALQTLAAFVIFILGYLALFVSLLVLLVIAKGIYEGARRVQAYAAGCVSANTFIPPDVETPAH
jgi:threonine/homoserine/homoserine lactone efflux protein